jgi:hypothetical protein
MRKLLSLLLLTLGIIPLARVAHAQSGSVTVTVVAPASLGTITISPASFYQSTAASPVLTSSTNGFNSTCTAQWDSSALVVTYSATTQKLTATVTAAMTATLGPHTITLTCTPPALTMNSPVILPNARLGQTYSADLASLAQLKGGIPPYSFTLTSGSLPSGLSLSSAGVVTGTALSAGSANFGFTVTDSSGAAMMFQVNSRRTT